MQSLKWFVAGAIGGAIGAAIWVAVGYLTSYEVGWIAWGIGVLVGIAVRKSAGKEIAWPAEANNIEALLKDQYPKEIWAEAEKRWASLSSQEQEEKTVIYKTDFARTMEQAESEVSAEVFKESFGPLDLLWFGLAAFTAFKIGSGLAKDE